MAGALPWSPFDLGDLVAWYSPYSVITESGTGRVITLLDQSGSGNDASPALATQRPLITAGALGRDCIRFDGGAGAPSSALGPVITLGAYTWIGYVEAWSGNSMIFACSPYDVHVLKYGGPVYARRIPAGGGTSRITQAAVSGSARYVLGASLGDTHAAGGVYLDGAPLATTNEATASTSVTVSGKIAVNRFETDASSYSGPLDVYDWLLFGRALTAEEHLQVANYLRGV